MKRIVIMGSQGAGKGTIAKMLEKEFGFAHISTGDMFREAIRNKTSLGEQAKKFLDAGHLVPDELTIQLVKERLGQPDCDKGFILDGFPRNTLQAKELEKFAHITDFLELEVDEKHVIDRLGGRLTCKTCAHVFNKKYNIPKQEGICDNCGGELKERADDNPESIKNRLRIYNEQTKQLIDYYKQTGVVEPVDANPSIPEVYANAKKALKL